MTSGKVPPEIDWNKLRRELEAYVRRRAPDLDAQDIAGTVIEKALLYGKKTPVTNYPGLAHEIVGKEIPNAIRRADRERRALSDIPADRGGRPKAEAFVLESELLAAVAADIASEFKETWDADAATALPGALAEMHQLPPRARRAWLAWALDHQLGDYAAWAVDPACRVGEAFRREQAKGVPTATPWTAAPVLEHPALELLRQPERMAELLAQSASQAEFEAAFWAAVPVPEQDPPLGGEFLTDREIAVVSLLLGNWPNTIAARVEAGKLAPPTSVGQVIGAEIEAIQYARKQHGLLRTAGKKIAAGVGPAARQKGPPEKT